MFLQGLLALRLGPRSSGGVAHRSVRRRVELGGHLGLIEVEDPCARRVPAIDQHVARVQVAVHDARGMHGGERPGELQADLDHLVGAQVVVGATKIVAGAPGHSSVTANSLLVVDPEVVDLRDVRVAQRGQHLGRAAEADRVVLARRPRRAGP
jgi:hypothetical protein